MGITTRGYSVENGPHKVVSRRESGDVGKEPRHIYFMSLAEADWHHYIGNFLNVLCSGDTSGSTIVPACFLQYPLFLRFEPVIRLRRG